MTKMCLSQHLMNSNLDFKKLLFLTFLKEMDDLSHFTHISPQQQFDTSNSCYFLLGQVFSISLQSPPLLFISPVIITLGWFFIKKLFSIFKCRSKMRKWKISHLFCFFHNKWESTFKERGRLFCMLGNIAKETYKQSLIGVNMKK